ncbi:hypothetical protein DFJ73DRAFT_769722 [Zopfochytrium polystomum]|nr:hypothetical protein DFJ73DRAFT_769722 [Zopfochytrium polystomum]
MEIEVDEMDAVLEFVVTRWTIGDVWRKGDCLPNHIAASNADAPPEHSHASSSAADDVQLKRARHASTLVTENIQLSEVVQSSHTTSSDADNLQLNGTHQLNHSLRSDGAVQAVQAGRSVAKEHQTQKQRVTRTEHVSIFKNAPSVEVTNRIAAMYENANLAPGTRKNRSLVEALYTGFVRGPEVKATTSDIFSVEVTAAQAMHKRNGQHAHCFSYGTVKTRLKTLLAIVMFSFAFKVAFHFQELTVGPSTTQLNEKATWFKNLGRTGQLELVAKSFSSLREYESVNPLFNERRRRVERLGNWWIHVANTIAHSTGARISSYTRAQGYGDKGDIVGKEARDELLRSCEQKILDGLIGDPFEGVDDESLFTKFIGGLNKITRMAGITSDNELPSKGFSHNYGIALVENDTVEAACLQIEEYTSATTSTARRKAIRDTQRTALTDEADQKFWDKRGTAPFLPRFDINEIVKAYGNLSEFLMFVMTFAVIDPSIIKQKLVYFLNIAKSSFPATLSLKITAAQYTPTRKNEKKST